MHLGPRRAIFLREGGELSVEDITEDYTPVGEQALVKVKYSAINPADQKHAFIGLCTGSVSGLEWVGTVVEVGDSCSFKIGEEIFGLGIYGRKRPLYLGCHQDYVIADGPQFAWPLPKGLSDQDAVSIPCAVGTAVDALFNILGFGFPPAGFDGRDATGVPILIWGGASAVGTATIQVAKAAGFAPIFTTASPKNHESLLKIGALSAFDYNSPTVVEDIRNAVAQSGKKLSVVADTVSDNGTPDMAKRCLSDDVRDEDLLLSSVLPVNDPAWKICLGARPYGESFWFIHDVTQDTEFPVRVKNYMDWFMRNHGNFWKPILRTTVVQGAEKGIEEIRRVAAGGVSREKVLIAHPF
ncbi:GroES-like protein [Aulographum hederae CBS 113979]|uniref:GroES-like protein n=1 Tax=Aulographum hederae CBS 113979 TaxID=1176131 RepID=A0A6G1GSF6_9PEZI|nr:GroES-like protein [Aulographum hederae CBS 113979]